MKFSDRLSKLRKEKKFSQGELASMIGVNANVLGRYERNEAKPIIDKAIKLAETLDVSVGYLVGKEDVHIDKMILNRVMLIQRLPKTDKDHILFTIDALIRDAKARSAYAL